MSTSPLIVGHSDIGLVRVRNEDTLVLLPELGVVAVADGMGGVPGGDVASRTAGETVEEILRDRLARPDLADTADRILASALESAITAAHRAVRRAGEADPALADMGTTLTVLAAPPGSGVWGLGHVGDSRAYRWRDGTLAQLTHDHTWIQTMVDQGRISGDQARWHPYRHVLSQCIGCPDGPEPQIEIGVARAGDLYLLCTDGLVGMLDDEALAAVLGTSVPAERDLDTLGALAARLVAAAIERGGEDNVTVALLGVGDLHAPTPARADG